MSDQKMEYLMLLEMKKRQRDALPHLHGFDKYQWQIDFFESRNRYNFLTAANQIGKSSIQICKCIEWATNSDLWPDLWEKRPTQFWYFYADATQATVEFHEKWIKEFLPREKEDPRYGWRAEYDSRRKISALHFNAGVSVYFKTYEQNVHSLQASTVFAVFADEEMPKHLFDEVNVRLIANRGYYHMVFTATRGQEFWRLTVEPKPGEAVNFPDAFKRQVSMYDCLVYANGKKSKWTIEYIKEIERSCSSENERLRRVYGRFVKSEGLLVHGFNRHRNTTYEPAVGDDWLWYSGVDCGNGGDRGHPPAIVFVAVSPDFTRGKVVHCWRGDEVAVSSAELLVKYQNMKALIPRNNIRGERYDFGGIGKDFGLLAERAGCSLVGAKKNRELGFGILNDVFQLGILEIVLKDHEAEKLCTEINSVSVDQTKFHAKDDLIDALRYACVDIPWRMDGAPKKPIVVSSPKFVGRANHYDVVDQGLTALLDEEFEDWSSDCEFLGY